MARNPRRIDAALQDLYDRVPDIPNCKGLCHRSCGPFDASVREVQRVERDSGRKLEAPALRCSMLDGMGRCTVYDHRPMVCRLWGAAEGLECPWGCRPERLLTRDEAFELYAESLRVGGLPRGLVINEDEQTLTSPLRDLVLGAEAIAAQIRGELS